MPKPVVSDADFVRLFSELGARGVARRLKLNERSVHRRRRNLELQHYLPLNSPNPVNGSGQFITRVAHDARILTTVKNGHVLVGSDAHIWPGKPSLGMRAFTQFAKELQPALVVLNGDVLDFPQISRHPPIGHQALPDVQDEIEAAQEQLHKIELAVKRSTKLVWTLGNHDARFETRLATIAPEFARLHGHSLKNYFPAWEPCWACWINNTVVVKHRFKGGVHATHNNAVQGGLSMVTGHLHSAKVTPWSDYSGTRYGVDTGCLADPNARQFLDYTEDNPKNWRQGFAVLTFKDGHLLPPELVTAWGDDSVTFRGEVIKVCSR